MTSRARSLATSALIERVHSLVVLKPAKLTGMGARVAGEVRVGVGLGEGADGYLIPVGDELDPAVIGVAGSARGAPIVIVDSLHRHAQDERIRTELAQSSEQELEIGEV